MVSIVTAELVETLEIEKNVGVLVVLVSGTVVVISAIVDVVSATIVVSAAVT